MTEYIDREAALAMVRPDDPIDERYAVTVATAKRLIRHALTAAPTADVAPVVRCRDCKWFANNNDGEWFGCWLFNAIRAVPEDAPTPDDFCSYGERKTVR